MFLKNYFFQNFRGCVSLFNYQGPFRFRNSLFLPQQQLVHSIMTLCACQELFFKSFFGFCSPQTDHFRSSLELQEPKPVAF